MLIRDNRPRSIVTANHHRAAAQEWVTPQGNELSANVQQSASLHAPLLIFWGKARRANVSGPDWHPAACHCLDVGAVAEALLDATPSLGLHFARQAGWKACDWNRVVVFLVALHDIGKFSRSFQSLSPAHWPSVLGDVATASGCRHDAIGAYLLRSQEIGALLARVFKDWSSGARGPLLDAIAGHHGRPVSGLSSPELRLHSTLGPESIEGATAFATELAALLSPPALPPPPKGWSQQASWWLAGLTMLCDWIGSAQQWFAYAGADVESVTAYWPQAQQRAIGALNASGLLPVRPGTVSGVAGLMPAIAAAGFAPTPLQRRAEQVELPAGPMTLLIEDATGSGKTEAALVLAHRLIAAGRADGLFIALPTMATADAMYLRLAAAYRALFHADDAPSLALAHGRAGLNAEFQGTIMPQYGLPQDVGDEAGPTASAMCSGWIAEERRRTFLAHVGVGTIDQVLLGVLPSRYAALRLFGLARRVLIVDEVHSYDVYMKLELERLLAFHRMLGGHSIVLSATLPQARRASLLNVVPTEDGDPATTPYPLLSVAADSAVQSYPEAMRQDLVRTLPVQRLASTVAAADYLVAAARGGACGVWIRNTVADAIEAADLVRAAGIKPLLFHARFAMGDRLAIQARVLERFGKESTPQVRAPGGMGLILIATQVVEQSLDLDADVMVSDLAPVDLLIQRAGRLCRHPWRVRPAAVDARLHVVSPEPVAVPGPGWAADPALGGTRFVYAPHILWLSARTLFAAGHIDVPNNLRALIESVYGAAAETVPLGLRQAESRAQGIEISRAGLARTNLLDAAQGYCLQNGQWASDTVMPTRLGTDDRVFRLAREENGRLVPFYADAEPWRAWALSEITLRPSQATQAVVPPRLEAALRRLRAEWPEWQREIPVLALDRNDTCVWRGRIKTLNGEVETTYSASRGLTF